MADKPSIKTAGKLTRRFKKIIGPLPDEDINRQLFEPIVWRFYKAISSRYCSAHRYQTIMPGASATERATISSSALVIDEKG
jgi:hypothetical protein